MILFVDVYSDMPFKVVTGDNIMSILKDNCRLFITKFELNNIEIEILKVTMQVDNQRINKTFIRIGK